MKISRVLLAVCVATATIGLTAPAATVAAPGVGAQVIVDYGFETEYPSNFAVTPISDDTAATTAYWGRISGRKRSGAYGLWCAGDNPANWVASNPLYPVDTRGAATFTLPTLADYYSSKLVYYYTMPSLGGGEEPVGLDVVWYASSNPLRTDYHFGFNLTGVNEWRRGEHSLTGTTNRVNLSRIPGEVVFAFNDTPDWDGGASVGEGPTVDDVTVTGYKYGPVRNLSATGASPGVRLDWRRPYRAVGSTTLEERTISYRVWRQPQAVPTDPWTELTDPARVTTAGENVAYTDASAVDGVLYRYMVIAYDSGSGTGYGESVETLGRYIAPPAPPTMTALTSSSHPVGTWVSASSVSLAWSATGTDVTGYGLTFNQSPSTIVSAQTTTAVGASVVAGASGTYYAHVAAFDVLDQTSTTRHLPVLVDVTDPAATDDIDPAGYEGTATVTLSATDAHSGVAAIEYSIDGGPATRVVGSSAGFEITTPGTYDIEYFAEDEAGNTGAPVSDTVIVTAVPPPAAPVVTALVSSSHPLGVWASSPNVSLAWSATGTGLTGYGLAFDQSPTTIVSAQTTTVASAQVTAAASGTYFAHVAARDSLNQMSATRHLQVRVDRTAPGATDDIAGETYVGAATVTFSATDAHSGVAAIEYSLDGAPYVRVSGSSASVTTTTPGAHTVSYFAEDNAGNTSIPIPDSFNVRALVPGIRVTASVNPLEVAAGQEATFSYLIENTGEVPISGIGLIDTVAGTPTGVPLSLAVGASAVATVDYLSQSGDGFVVNTATVSGSSSGGAVTDLSVVGLDVHTAGLSIAAGPAMRWVSQGKRAAYEVVVTNTGDVALNVGGTLTRGTRSAGLSAGAIAPGGTATLAAEVAIDVAGTVSVAVTGVGDAGMAWQTNASDSAIAQASIVPPRFAGTTRTATAVELSKAAFPSGAPAVVIATGWGFPDALSAASLAGSVGGPLLLVKGDSVPPEVLAEIDRLNATKAYIIGGTAVVQPAVETALRSAGLTIERIAGGNRYDTAKRVGDKVRAREGARQTVFLATGLNFPDALAASSLAASMRAPILLTKPDALPADTLAALTALKPTTVVICGGTGAVSDAVKAQVAGTGATVVRKGGANRYETARLIIEWGRTSAGLAPDGIDGVFLATGKAFPDALAGGVFASAYPDAGWRPLMLTDAAVLSPDVAMLIQGNAGVGFVSAIGGTSALPEATYQSALGYVP